MGEDPLAELERILTEEREAIRTLDAPAVLAFAQRKEAIVTALPDPLPDASRARLQALAPALRHNGVLLAHVRGVLADALKVLRPEAVSTRTASPAATPRLLSVRG